MDKLTPEQRHRCMVANKGSGTKPEMLVRRFLHKNGFRYRVNVRTLPGTPDIVLKKYRTCIFVNGCFWHGHEECGTYRQPKANNNYWYDKIENNRMRDQRALVELEEKGWHCITVWECQLKPKVRGITLNHIIVTLNYILNTLKTAKPKPYTAEENNSLAAEDEAEYCSYY